MTDLIILLSACLAAVLLTSLLRCKKYAVSYWKAGVLGLSTMVLGLLGTFILYFIENGVWGGMSFFGGVLFTPLLMLPVAYLCKVRRRDMLDLITMPGLAMFCIYKFNCYLSGCCRGMILGHAEGKPIVFPSQIVESASALLILLILLLVERKRRPEGRLWPLALILYGAVRFGLNWLRRDQVPFVWVLPAGAFWALVSIAVGIVWLCLLHKRTVAPVN